MFGALGVKVAFFLIFGDSIRVLRLLVVLPHLWGLGDSGLARPSSAVPQSGGSESSGSKSPGLAICSLTLNPKP